MSDFATLQQQFMDAIRATDIDTPPLGIEPRRMQVYRELMFNNVAGFIDSGFPVLRSLTAPLDWQQQQRHFFADYDCQSPLFVDISASFVDYLAQKLTKQSWQYQLAHYEQLELKVDTLPEAVNQPQLESAQQLLTQPLQLYSAVQLGRYDFAVHQLGVDNPEPQQQPTFVLVYRDLDDDVAFMALNPVSVQLYDYLLAQPGCSAEQAIGAMVASLPQLDATAVAQGAGQLLLQWHELGVLRKANAYQSS